MNIQQGMKDARELARQQNELVQQQNPTLNGMTDARELARRQHKLQSDYNRSLLLLVVMQMTRSTS
jgi:hypothetical protein